MGRVKDLWMDEMAKQFTALVKSGMSKEDAYEKLFPSYNDEPLESRKVK